MLLVIFNEQSRNAAEDPVTAIRPVSSQWTNCSAIITMSSTYHSVSLSTCTSITNIITSFDFLFTSPPFHSHSRSGRVPNHHAESFRGLFEQFQQHHPNFSLTANILTGFLLFMLHYQQQQISVHINQTIQLVTWR